LRRGTPSTRALTSTPPDCSTAAREEVAAHGASATAAYARQTAIRRWIRSVVLYNLLVRGILLLGGDRVVGFDAEGARHLTPWAGLPPTPRPPRSAPRSRARQRSGTLGCPCGSSPDVNPAGHVPRPAAELARSHGNRPGHRARPAATTSSTTADARRTAPDKSAPIQGGTRGEPHAAGAHPAAGAARNPSAEGPRERERETQTQRQREHESESERGSLPPHPTPPSLSFDRPREDLWRTQSITSYPASDGQTSNGTSPMPLLKRYGRRGTSTRPGIGRRVCP